MRLALLRHPSWLVEEVAPENAIVRSRELSGIGVVFISVGHLLHISPRPLPMPVLAFGPPALFDAVPGRLCDDLIGEQWSAAELRYRLGRLARPSAAVIDGHTLSCAPYRLIADELSVDLTLTQYQLVTLLLRVRATSVTREALAAVVNASGLREEGGRALDMQISRLRSKLREVTSDWVLPPRITAQSGRGYSLVF